MNTNYSIEALEILLDKECLAERYHPLIQYKNILINGLISLHCRTKNDAALLPDTDYAEIGMEAAESVRLLRKFFTIYDPNPQKFREIDKLGLDSEEKLSFGELYYLPGVKQTRASLYYKAGYRTLADFVNTSPEEVAERTAGAILEYHLSCIVPLPKEIRTHIAVAKAFLWNS